MSNRYIDIMSKSQVDDSVWNERTFISSSLLHRDYTVLGAVKSPGEHYDFWLTDCDGAQVTWQRADDEGFPTNQLVVDLHFAIHDLGIPVVSPLQVDSVSTAPAFRGMSFASMLYVMLASRGHTIVSSFTQNSGGKGLWKKIARESVPRKYVVRIWDTGTKDWFRVDTGAPIKYNALNLSEDKVWRGIEDLGESTTLLVLSKY